MRRVAVAGAGIGGLAAALCLARAGCSVCLFDRSPLLAEAGAGLQLSPNASSVLRRLGVLDAVAPDAVAIAMVRIGRGRDACVLARLPLGPAAEARYGAPFLVTLRADLHRVLLDAVRATPDIRLETGRSLAGWSAEGAGVQLAFTGDAAMSVDGLVGADGLHSVVRRQLHPSETAASARRTAWRALIAADDLPESFRQTCSNLWLGSKAHLVHYPVAGGRLVNVVAVIDEAREDPALRGLWSCPGDPAEIRRRFAGWAPQLRQLIAASPQWSTWPLADRPALARWSDGPVTLLGDAAHPMLPFLAQGAAQALEDAAALGDAVAQRGEDLPAAFRRYDRTRRDRTARVQAESRRQAAIYHLGGPAAALRDAVLSHMPQRRLQARYDWLYGHRA